MTIPLIFLPKEKLSDWLFHLFLLLVGLPFAWMFYVTSFAKWFFVEIGTPAGKVSLTSFISWIPSEQKQRIAYSKAKEVADTLLSRIG